jgi:serine/threonine protein kinase
MHLGNLLLCNSPLGYITKISDFGLGKYVNSNDSMTADIGAANFRAPEAYGNVYTTKCDVWSFGIILGKLCELFHEQELGVAHSEESLSEDLKRSLDLRPYDLSRLGSWRNDAIVAIHPEFRSLGENCLNWDDTKRPNFQAIIAELLEIELCLGIERKRITSLN